MATSSGSGSSLPDQLPGVLSQSLLPPIQVRFSAVTVDTELRQMTHHHHEREPGRRAGK